MYVWWNVENETRVIKKSGKEHIYCKVNKRHIIKQATIGLFILMIPYNMDIQQHNKIIHKCDINQKSLLKNFIIKKSAILVYVRKFYP